MSLIPKNSGNFNCHWATNHAAPHIKPNRVTLLKTFSTKLSAAIFINSTYTITTAFGNNIGKWGGAQKRCPISDYQTPVSQRKNPRRCPLLSCGHGDGNAT